MKICKDGRIWGQNNKEAKEHLGSLKCGSHIKENYVKKGYNPNSAIKKGTNSRKDEGTLLSGKNHPMFGKHHSIMAKEKIGKASEGRKPNLGRIFSKVWKENMSKGRMGMHLSETHKENISKALLGNKHTLGFHPYLESRNKMSERQKGENNPMYGKSPAHRKGAYYKRIWMRSSWEVKIAEWLDKQNWKWLYEPKRFELKDMTYLPDFYLPSLNVWWEVKGWFDKQSRERISQFRELYPNERLLVLTKEVYEMMLNSNGGEL